ncbi:OmpA family protein [Maribacter algarum]|uniref:OmpA family protein n=1 Tax=Maribacter algarum (ex Zhang et al. 2020) TaxID=2578118 RepID=A0A5S3PSU2_9FLAO|nr:OmpA family protein [Maribacter algarum]TMM57978.1 OmpA family protein [Maribacter algarum]
MAVSYFSKHKRYFVLIALFYCGLTACLAQNLVKNPSFEDYVQCPSDYATFHKDVLFWTCPTNGSTDYFNSCSKQMSVGRNFAGHQNVFNGKGYAGFYAFGPKDYREYIGGELKQVLQKDKKYLVSVVVSLSDKSAYAVKELGFLFGDKPLNLQTTRNIPHRMMLQEGLSNYLGMTNTKYFSNKSDWMEIRSEYIANGNERYFTFGNFKENRKTQMIVTGKNLKKASYYYVDMISISEAEPSFLLDEIYVFEGLNFDVDGFQIKEESQGKLRGLLDYLKENPSLNIAIYGHTDNYGNKDYNLDLSGKRAKSVGLFLVENGLSPFRIAWKGYGDAKPLMANKTEIGREKNRRVEFIISKKKREYYASGLFEDEDDN